MLVWRKSSHMASLQKGSWNNNMESPDRWIGTCCWSVNLCWDPAKWWRRGSGQVHKMVLRSSSYQADPGLRNGLRCRRCIWMVALCLLCSSSHLWEKSYRHDVWHVWQDCVRHLLPHEYILKAKKFAEPLFQSKKFAEKMRELGHFGPFWLIFCHFWAILWHF